MKKWNQNWASPPKVLLAGLCIGALAMLAPLVVSAVAPPANSSIGNAAGASYIDAAGRPQNVLSNQVSTLVAQVGNLLLTNDNTKSTSVGNTVYMPHTLTNLGNGPDSFVITVVDNNAPNAFSRIEIFPDAAGDGSASSTIPLCSSAGPTLCTAGFTQQLSANGIFNFVVAYQVPATAPSAATPFGTGTVKAQAQTPAIYTTSFDTDLDTVNTTTGAAFAATKALAAPAVPAVGGGAWPAVVTTGKASPASCDTTWPLATDAACTYTVYTVSYQNNGASVGAFSMQDTIPTGMTFVTGSAVWSGNGGIAMSDTSTLTQTGTGANVVKSSYDPTSKVFTVVVPTVSPNVSGTVSFVVLINNNALVGQSTTTNTANFRTTSCDLSLSTSPTNCAGTPTTTNRSPFTITATYSVVAANVASTTHDASSAPPDRSGIDLVVQPTVAPGGSVSFTDVITNTGNDSDIFNLTVSSTTESFPAGTRFEFFHADGVTPLLDSNGDNIPDTGPVTPGISNAVRVVLRATIPANTASGTGPFFVLTTATSAGNGAALPAVYDSVWNKVTIVAPTVLRIDLTNTAVGNRVIVDGVETGACNPGTNCDLGAGPSSGPTDTESTTAGTGVIFPLFLKNTDSSAGSYNLTVPTLPTGWTVKFVADGGTCASAAIAQPFAVPAVSQGKVLACVTPPTGTPPGVSNVNIKVTSAIDPGVNDTITDAVRVNVPILRALSLTPSSGSNTINGGGTAVQPATLTNIGNQNCGATNGFNVTVSVDSASAAAGWTATVYYDKTPIGELGAPPDVLLGGPTATGAGNLSATIDTGIVPLVPGANAPLLVKFFAPSNAVNGATATATLTVDDRNPVTAERCPSQTSQFTATVANGLLRLTKLQALDLNCTGGASLPDSAFSVAQLSIKPNQCLVYRVKASNEGAVPVTRVDIKDTAPSFTTYQSTAGASLCTLTGSGSGTPVFAVNADGLECWGGATGSGLTLNSGASLTMQFPVKVQN